MAKTIIPQASTHVNLYTNQHPSFDSLDEMIAWAVSQGATHISLSNYHEGAFWKAKNPNAEKSYCEVMHFGQRYGVDNTTDLHDKNHFQWYPNIGWYCHSEWGWGDSFRLDNENSMYPFFRIGSEANNEVIRDYMNNMRASHDYNTGMEYKYTEALKARHKS